MLTTSSHSFVAIDGEVQSIFVKPISFFELSTHTTSTKASLRLTNYRLFLHGYDSISGRETTVSVPLLTIDSVKKKQPSATNILIKIQTKHFRFITMVFENQPKQANAVHAYLQVNTTLTNVLKAFAFQFKQNLPQVRKSKVKETF